MTQEYRAGAAHWIDHFVVPTNDVLRWKGFMEHVLGGQDSGGDPGRLSFMSVGLHHLGGSYQPARLSDPPPLGKALPRYGFYVRREELDAHLHRFEQFGVQFSDPCRTSVHGEEGTAVSFRDPDGNEYELWAPERLPRGAMESGNPLGIGRIGFAILESRDVSRSLEFHGQYLAVDPERSADIPSNVLVMRLAGGGRLIFEKIEPEAVTRGGEAYSGAHTAFTVRDEEWDLVHHRLWAGLPEAPEDAPRVAGEDVGTRLHEPWTRQRASMRNRGLTTPRGYSFCDWDNNQYHFVRGRFAPEDTAYYDTVDTLAE